MKSVVAVSAVLIAATAAGIGLGHLAARFLPSGWFDAELFEVVTDVTSLADVVNPSAVGNPGTMAGVVDKAGVERLSQL